MQVEAYNNWFETYKTFLGIGSNFPNLSPAYLESNIGEDEINVMAKMLKPKGKATSALSKIG
jgi:hypothetical protein